MQIGVFFLMVVVLVNYNSPDSNNHKKIQAKEQHACSMHIYIQTYQLCGKTLHWCLGGEEMNINA